MRDDQQKAMRQLQERILTKYDIAEYLDTHPDDAFAMERYAMTVQQYQEMMRAYTANYGPLNLAEAAASANSWLWAEQPFPWDL